ncbi:cytochrome c3 family protein [Chloroflexota bacterium]
MTKRLIIALAILIVIAAVVTVALSNSVSNISLSAQEEDLIIQSCADCHNESGLARVQLHITHEETSCLSCHESVHSIHANADCQDCHVGTTGLKTADQAHDILRWIGIGGAGLLVIFLGINFFILRLRIGKKENGNG